MTTQAERDMECALELVYGGTQDIEAGCVLDKLRDMGWRLVRVTDPVAVPDVASTRGLPRRRSA